MENSEKIKELGQKIDSHDQALKRVLSSFESINIKFKKISDSQIEIANSLERISISSLKTHEDIKKTVKHYEEDLTNNNNIYINILKEKIGQLVNEINDKFSNMDKQFENKLSEYEKMIKTNDVSLNKLGESVDESAKSFQLQVDKTYNEFKSNLKKDFDNITKKLHESGKEINKEKVTIITSISNKNNEYLKELNTILAQQESKFKSIVSIMNKYKYKNK